MKRVALIGFVLVCVSLLAAGVASAQKMESVTGKVSAVDPEGKGIVVMKGSGDSAMDVGTIVSPDTVVKVKGKKASISDIKAGDMVTIKFERSTDLFAKEIVKKK